MRRRTLIKMFATGGLLATYGCVSSGHTDSELNKMLRPGAFCMRWDLDDTGESFLIRASESKVDGLTETALCLWKASRTKPIKVFETSDDGALEYAVPIIGFPLLITVWAGGSSEFIKVLWRHNEKFQIVLEERIANVELIHAKSPVLIIASTNGFPGDPKKWIAAVFVWSGSGFEIYERCPFFERFQNLQTLF